MNNIEPKIKEHFKAIYHDLFFAQCEVLKIIFFVLKPLYFTRIIAACRIKGNKIRGFHDMLKWNNVFYLSLLFSISLTIPLRHNESNLQYVIVAVMMFVCLVRINELVIAFFADALPENLHVSRSELDCCKYRGTNKVRGGLPINKRERIILLAMAYIEIILSFGIIYWGIFVIFDHCSFGKNFSGLIDGFYFSAITITTTGFGDMAPTNFIAKVFVIYEVIIGVIFIALTLAAYISKDDRAINQPYEEMWPK